MRAIVGITCMLIGFGMLSCRYDGASQLQSAPLSPTTWVRTVDGWERPASWHVPAVAPLRLHPLVVAAGQGLLSVLALAVFSCKR